MVQQLPRWQVLEGFEPNLDEPELRSASQKHTGDINKLFQVHPLSTITLLPCAAPLITLPTCPL